jgi:hypothetical protein
MPTWTRSMALALVAGLAACEGGGADRGRTDALASRIDQLEKRLAAAETSAEPVERLRTDTANLDRRVSSLEANVREIASRPATGAPPATVPALAGSTASTLPPPQLRDRPQTGDRRMDRRTQLRALSDEFRSKVAELRSQPPAQQQQSSQELLQWYREQRRAVLRSGARTDQPPAE